MLSHTIRNLSEALRTILDLEGTELLRDHGNAARFIFIEKWEAIAAHKNSSEYLPTNCFARIMGALEGKPNKTYLDVIKKTQRLWRHHHHKKWLKAQEWRGIS